MSSTTENLSDLISRRLTEMAAVKRIDDGLRVTTHCMYPSNGFVQVTVRGGATTVVASDEGGAMGEALSAGIPMRDFSRQLAHRVNDQGLSFKNGVIFTPKMPIEAAPFAILLVANASQEIAHYLYEHMKIKRSRPANSFSRRLLPRQPYEATLSQCRELVQLKIQGQFVFTPLCPDRFPRATNLK